MKQPSDHLLFLKKAKEDEELLKSILTETQIADSIFGFHAQQAVEKLLKAILSNAKVIFPKTHDLSVLIDLLVQSQITIPFLDDDLEELTPYAVTFRYDESSDKILDRQKSLTLVRSLREWVEQRFRKVE